MSLTAKLYSNLLSIAPGITSQTDVDILRIIYKPSDLYWVHQMYKIECRNGNWIHCDNFYNREERLRHILRARKLLAECVFISRLYPEASWTQPMAE
jgi:hypothetical protein